MNDATVLLLAVLVIWHGFDIGSLRRRVADLEEQEYEDGKYE